MGGQRQAPAALPHRNRGPISIVQDAGLALWPVWACEVNFAPTGFHSQDRPARSEPKMLLLNIITRN